MMTKRTPVNFPIDFYGMEELGQAIKRVRKLRGMTQRELSMRTNTSEKFISNVENGKETAHLGKVLLLIRVLDMGTRLTDLRARRGA
jgi:transcriptional regulator with XRE-family HTH domain